METIISKLDSFNKTIRTDPMAAYLEKNPQQKSRITPQMLRCMSLCGISYFIGFGFILMAASFWISMPVVYEEPLEFWPRVLVALYIYSQMMLNFALVSLRRSFYDSRKGSHGIPDPSWQKCVDCDQLVPPRAHHCPLCQHCVLRRDHHCFFTGSCIGFANQRFFIVFCFHCMLGASYATYVTVEYIYIAHMSSDSGLVHFIPPLTTLEWLFGFSTFGFLFFVILMYLCGMAAMGSAGIMVWQLFLVAQGSTSFEYGKGLIKYKTGILHNFRSVFGSYWLLNFIFPLMWIDIPGNGVDWNVSKYV